MILGCSPGCAAISFCECANTKLTYPSCETQDATGEGQGLASSGLVLLTWQALMSLPRKTCGHSLGSRGQ